MGAVDWVNDKRAGIPSPISGVCTVQGNAPGNLRMRVNLEVGRSGLRRESRATQADSLTVLEASKSEEGYAETGRIHREVKHCRVNINRAD